MKTRRMLCQYCGRTKTYPTDFPNRFEARCFRCYGKELFGDVPLRKTVAVTLFWFGLAFFVLLGALGVFALARVLL